MDNTLHMREMDKNDKMNPMNEHLYNIILNGDLDSLKELHKRGELTIEHVVGVRSVGLFFVAIAHGEIDVCKWFYENYELKTKNIIKPEIAFETACWNNQIKICEWLVLTFEITKDDVLIKNNDILYWSCIMGKYKVINFLCNTIGVTEKEIKDLLHNCGKEITNKNKIKILECLPPLGSFTKPVKL